MVIQKIFSYSLFFISFCTTFLLITFLLDGFKLSDNKYIKFFQIILFCFLLILIIYEYLNYGPVYTSSGDDKDQKFK